MVRAHAFRKDSWEALGRFKGYIRHAANEVRHDFRAGEKEGVRVRVRMAAEDMSWLELKDLGKQVAIPSPGHGHPPVNPYIVRAKVRAGSRPGSGPKL